MSWRFPLCAFACEHAFQCPSVCVCVCVYVFACSPYSLLLQGLQISKPFQEAIMVLLEQWRAAQYWLF